MIDTLGYILAILCLLTFGSSVKGQIPISWSQNLGDDQKNIIQDVINIDDQGCLTIGYTQNGDLHDFDLWINRINNDGTLLWSKDFGGTAFERATAATLLDDGNLIVVGYGTLTDGDSNGASKRADGVVLKISPTGTIIWQKTYGGLGQDQFSDVVALPSGECLAVGSTTSYINNFDDRVTDGWAVRINTSGGATWNRRFGGSLMDRYTRVLHNDDGSFMLGGISNSSDGESADYFGADDLWISKINANGTHAWSRNYGGTENDLLNALSPTIDGGYIIGATSFSNLPGQKGYGDVWVLKVSALGNQVWGKVYGGTATDKCTDIVPFEGDGFLMTSVTLSNDGDFSSSLGGQDAWLSKLTATGSMEWSEQLGGSHNDAINALAVTTDGSVWMSGYSFSPDGDLLANMGKQDGWLLRSNSELPPTVRLGGNVEICIGAEIILDATDPNCSTCQYLWNDNVTTPTRTILVSGSATYSVTLTNNAGDSTSDTIDITAINSINATANITDVTCADSATGSISVTATQGTGDYTYNWSNGAMTALNTNLESSTYFVTISDEALCVYTDSYTLDNPAPIEVDATIELPSCTSSNQGSISLNVTGGESPYTYMWSNGFIGPSITGLEPGEYMVTITDARNCVHVEMFLLSNDATINASADIMHVTCFSNSDGEIVLNATGDFPPLSFKWGNNFTSNSILGLPGGEYTVTITDAMDCQLINKYVVIEPSEIQVIQDQVNTAMSAATGSLLLNISGGVAPYNVMWSNGEIGLLIIDLDVGFYTATVTDANDCIYEETYEITVATGTSTIFAQALDVHPNPNGGRFFVQAPANLSADFEITMYNLSGQEIGLERSFNMNGQVAIEVKDHVPGLYLMSIRDGFHVYQSKVILH